MSKGGGFDRAGFFDSEHVYEVSETITPGCSLVCDSITERW
jgi:hypothetical protein